MLHALCLIGSLVAPRPALTHVVESVSRALRCPESVVSDEALRVWSVRLEAAIGPAERRGDRIAVANLLVSRYAAESTLLRRRLPAAIAAALPADPYPPSPLGHSATEDRATLAQSFAPFRVRYPEAYGRLVNCDAARAVVAGVCRSRGDGFPIVFSGEAPSVNVWGENSMLSDRTVVRLSPRVADRDAGVQLSCLLFEVMNSSDYAAKQVHWIAAQRRSVGRRDYVLDGVRLEAFAALWSQVLLAHLLRCGSDGTAMPAEHWRLPVDSTFADRFRNDPAWSTEGFPWSSHGKSYDAAMFRRAVEDRNYWGIAIGAARVRSGQPGQIEREYRLDEVDAYLMRKFGARTLLGAFVRLPDRSRNRVATSPAAVAAILAADFYLSILRSIWGVGAGSRSPL